MYEKNQGISRHLPKLLVAVSLVAALFIGALVLAPQLVQAQEETPEAPPAGLGFRGMKGFLPGHGFGFAPGSEYDTYLAEALGISLEELQAAYQKANAAALEFAVAQGRLTEEQAELIRARWALMDYLDFDAIYAEAMGISVEEFQAARESGTSLPALLDELGIDLQTFRQALQSAFEEAVQQAVEAGVITQEQADQILSMGAGMHDWGAFHGFRGGHGFQRGWGGCPSTEQGDTNG